MEFYFGNDGADWFAVLFSNAAEVRPVVKEVAVGEYGVWFTEFVVYELHYGWEIHFVLILFFVVGERERGVRRGNRAMLWKDKGYRIVVMVDVSAI